MSFQVTVQPSNHQFPVEPGQTVLNAALVAGIVLSYSCRNGACSSCKGKVVSGEFDAGHYPAQVLSPEELAHDFTLFCQTRPSSDMVVESREVRLASDIQIRKLPAQVMSLERLGQDVAVLKVQLPATEPFRFYAGQYIEVILKDGRRRSYSMASAPHAGSPIELHIRHMPGGVFTDHVFGAGDTQMKEREILRLEGPFGSFFLREDSDKPIVLLATGTGFALIKSIVDYIAHHAIQRPLTLYWGERRDPPTCICTIWCNPGKALYPTFVTCRSSPMLCRKTTGQAEWAMSTRQSCKTWTSCPGSRSMRVARPPWLRRRGANSAPNALCPKPSFSQTPSPHKPI